LAIDSQHRSSATRFAWYFRFQLSLRDIEELLFERGVVVSYEVIRRWTDKFGAGFAHQVRTARRKRGSTWHLDEMFVTLRGEPWLLWRAIDEHGIELDILLQKGRDKSAAKRFFKRVLAASPAAPKKIVTDQLRSYPAAKSEIPELANVKHVFVKACARVNASAGCEVSACPNARSLFCRASVRYASTLRSSVICCAPHSIASSSPRDLKRGVSLPVSPKLRPPCSEEQLLFADILSWSQQRDNAL
jgi:putative transposase